MVVSDEQLVGEQSGQDLGAVVVQASVPGSLVKMELGFKPLVKRLGSRTSPRIEKAGRLGLEIAESRLSPRAGLSPGKVGVVKRSRPSVMSPTIDLGT